VKKESFYIVVVVVVVVIVVAGAVVAVVDFGHSYKRFCFLQKCHEDNAKSIVVQFNLSIKLDTELFTDLGKVNFPMVVRS